MSLKRNDHCILSTGTIESFETALNEYFYSTRWRVSEDSSGVHATNIHIPGLTLSPAYIIHKDGRYKLMAPKYIES
jgi:hypothetical protein